jgi:hypothetical protein
MTTRTNVELLEEISALKQRIQALELSESDRRQSEQVLRESENRYRLLTEAIDEVF